MKHELKTWPEYYRAIRDNIKKFEFRVNDRNFKVGDELILREYEPFSESYTERDKNEYIHCYVLYILPVITDPPTNYVIMSITSRVEKRDVDVGMGKCEECKIKYATTYYGDLNVCEQCDDKLNDEFDEEYK